MAKKITFADFAGLASGRIARLSHISSKTPTATLEYDRANRLFRMEKKVAGKTELHTLAYDTTDEVRLNAHWQGFCK